VKPENIIVFKDGTCKLTDFGLAEWFDPQQERKTNKGTNRYLAREVILGRRQDQSIDVWAMAVTLVVAMSGMFPYAGDEYEYATQVVLGEPDLSEITEWDKEVQAVIGKMLSNNPKERPTAAWLLEWATHNLRS
jgi:serine/threonine protein kinase